MNLLILAGIDLSRRSGGRLLSRQTAAHARRALASVLLASFVAFAVLVPMTPLFGRFHWGSLLLLVGYLMTFRLVYIDRRLATAETIVEIADEVLEPRQTLPTPSILRPAILYAIATLGIFVLAPRWRPPPKSWRRCCDSVERFLGPSFWPLSLPCPKS